MASGGNTRASARAGRLAAAQGALPGGAARRPHQPARVPHLLLLTGAVTAHKSRAVTAHSHGAQSRRTVPPQGIVAVPCPGARPSARALLPDERSAATRSRLTGCRRGVSRRQSRRIVTPVTHTQSVTHAHSRTLTHTHMRTHIRTHTHRRGGAGPAPRRRRRLRIESRID